jgi:hypothetical protein
MLSLLRAAAPTALLIAASLSMPAVACKSDKEQWSEERRRVYEEFERERRDRNAAAVEAQRAIVAAAERQLEKSRRTKSVRAAQMARDERQLKDEREKLIRLQKASDAGAPAC